MHGELADSRLVARRVADNRRILAASPAYLNAHRSHTQPEELERHNCLVFAYPGQLQSTWPLRIARISIHR
ncbi:MAG: LysR substrate-binding domain-containing protein [Pseudomonas sp.]|uniref:LysR substrate-binding domain-containing protein n=1 Tax=Pseudomonas sp. TaxID=306 RepID=UPI003982B7B9